MFLHAAGNIFVSGWTRSRINRLESVTSYGAPCSSVPEVPEAQTLEAEVPQTL